MGQKISPEMLLVVLVGSQLCARAASIQTGLPKKLDKFESPHLNETHRSASVSQLDTIFTPKIFSSHDLGQRSGIGIAKGPPDLQFGLAFTVPFVSLSTERLLQQVSQHRGYDSLWDLANVLKLNVGGLVTVAVVGIAALFFIPALLPKFGFGHAGGGGGWPSGGFGGFIPGFLEQLVPGFGLNKPLGYGQSYDYNTLPYNIDYLPSPSQRSEHDAKSRALKDDPTQNGTVPNFWTNVIREVRKTAAEFEKCALYAMCERGKNATSELTNPTTRAPQRGRSGRAESNSNSGGHVLEDEQPISRFDDIFGSMARSFGEELPSLIHMQKAFETGKIGNDCTKFYKKCPLSKLPIDDMVKNVGDYIFT